MMSNFRKNALLIVTCLFIASSVAFAMKINGQLEGAILERLGSDPSGTGNVEGRVYYNTGTDVAKMYTGAGWVTLADTAAVVANPMDSAGDMMYGGTGGTVTKLDSGTLGQIMISGGAAAPVWTTLLPLANGGTNKAATAVNGGLCYSDSDSLEITSAGTASQWVLSGGAGAPTMSNTTTTAKMIDGSADAVQLRLQAHSTMTSALGVVLAVEDSSATQQFTVSNTGDVIAAGEVLAGLGDVNHPSHSFLLDTDTGIYSLGNNTVAIGTNNTLRWDIDQTDIVTTLVQLGPDGAVGAPTYSFSDDTNTGIWSAAADNITFSTAGAEIAEMDASTFRVAGKIGANSTATSYFHTVLDTFSSANGFGLRIQDTDGTGTATNILSQFDFSADDNAAGAYLLQFTDSTDLLGGITVTGDLGVTYGSTSDERLKKNGREMLDGVERVKKMIPRYFQWKGSGDPSEGFYAQELLKIVPEAVSGSPDGDPHLAPLMVDYGKVTPVLAAAIKELIAQNEEMLDRIAKLEKKLKDK